jgi:uncharacterized RDD family membrane protein YckC
LDKQIQSNVKKKKTPQPVPGNPPSFNGLTELQDFLSTELIEQGTAYRRAFIPLTDGLGLESPKNLTPKFKSPERQETHLNETSNNIIETINPPQPQEALIFHEEATITSKKSSPPPLKPENKITENRLAEVMEPPPMPQTAPSFDPEEKSVRLEVDSVSDKQTTPQPPPLPRPSVFTRLLAGIIDHVFVIFIWTGMIVLTSNLMNDFATGFSIEVLTDFGQPKFLRMAVLEFAAAWFGYLGFSFLIAKRTFGMWVWAIGVSYGDKEEENYTMRKAMRIFWTFLFSAPIVPSIILAIQKNGRNILDVLSGTNVYDAQ